MDVSVLVVGWNCRHFVYDCLKSVYAETKGINFEVIYVDNGSIDKTVDMVKKEYPRTRIIENKENLGFIKANNQAIRIAKGKYVLLLNSDTIVLENAIAKTFKFAENHPDTAVVGCQVYKPGMKIKQKNAFRFYSTLNMFFHATYLSQFFPKNKLFGRKRYAGWNFDTEREVDVIIGCFSFVRMKAIEQVGVMEELFFLYGDDIDWCYRFRKAGWKIMFTPEPKIIHYGGGSRKSSRKRAMKFQYQVFGSGLINVKKHYSHTTFLLCRLLTACFFFFRIPYWILIGIFQKKERLISFLTAKSYLLGGIYSVFNWTKLLINEDEVKQKLYNKVKKIT